MTALVAREKLKSFLFRETTDQQLLILGAVSLVVFVMVALMLVPLGLPHFEHVVGYWWADERFKDAVGQSQKILWYKKTAFSALFLVWLLATAKIWTLVLRAKRNGFVLAWAYFVFGVTVIASQFLVLGGWKTHADVNLMDGFDECPSLVKIVDRIDSPSAFLQDMVKYAGVDGRLRGSLAIKPPAYVLMIYYMDQVGKIGLKILNLQVEDLDLRAAAMSCVFVLFIGLFLFPVFALLRRVFDQNFARLGLLILSMSPLVSHGFAHMQALSHHILIPVSAVSLYLFVVGWLNKRVPWIVASFIVPGLAGLVVWESFAWLGILAIAAGLIMNRWLLVAKILGGLFGLMIAVGVLLKIFFGINLATHFWHHFIEAHLVVHFHKMFINKGPIVYLLSTITNVTTFAFFIGVPLSVMIFHSVRRNLMIKLKSLSLADALVRATFLFVLALDLGGLSSETSRLWAFMTPAWYFTALRELEFANDKNSLSRIALAVYFLNGLQILILRNVTYYI